MGLVAQESTAWQKERHVQHHQHGLGDFHGIHDEEGYRPEWDPKFKDGWAHVENMNSAEGILMELNGMLHNDRHERLMGSSTGSNLSTA